MHQFYILFKNKKYNHSQSGTYEIEIHASKGLFNQTKLNLYNRLKKQG